MGFFIPNSSRFYKFAMSASVSFRASKDRRKSRYSLDIRLGKAIAASQGWPLNTRLEIMFGQGADFGKVCLRKVENGPARLRPGSTLKTQSFLVSTSRIPRVDIMDEHGGVWRFIWQNQLSTPAAHFVLPEGRLGLELPREWFEQVKAPKKFAVYG